MRKLLSNPSKALACILMQLRRRQSQHSRLRRLCWLSGSKASGLMMLMGQQRPGDMEAMAACLHRH